MIEEAVKEFSAFYSQLDRIQYEVTALLSELNFMRITPYKYTSKDMTNIRLVENMLQSIRRTSRGILNIYVIHDKKPRTLYSSIPTNISLLLEKPWLQYDYTSSVEWNFIPPHEADYYYPKDKNKIISFVSGMIKTNNDEKFDFLIQIDVSSSYVENVFSPVISGSENSFIVLADKDGIVLELSNNNYNQETLSNELLKTMADKDDGVQFIKGHKYMAIKSVIEDTGLTVYKFSPVELRENEIELIIKSILLILMSTVFATVTGFLLASTITRPIQKLIENIGNIVTEDKVLGLPPLNSVNKDIQSLENSFNIMINRINSLIHDNVQKEKEKKDIEIQMLQRQISPHFLYNTLNSIKFMAFIAKQNQIADAIVCLVNMLEFCFRDNQTMVTVKDEIDFLKQYIILQKMRYGDEVRVDFVLDEEIYNLYIQKFTLHPSIENIFIHAFNKKICEPQIIVKGYISDGKLIFKIKDNGVGFDMKLLEHSSGIGIKNVNERIRLTFGDEYGQKIESYVGKGTTVTITLPIIKDREDLANV